MWLVLGIELIIDNAIGCGCGGGWWWWVCGWLGGTKWGADTCGDEG